jgi:RimJ/RimL family protein N-acetyltransferase
MGNDSIEIKRIVVEVKNRGIGRKSLKAIIKYLFEEKNVHRVWLDYHQFNEVGAYLYESMGFIKEGVLRESLKLDGKYYDVVVLSMLKSEYFQN